MPTRARVSWPGAPIAPALSKLALYDCCQRAHASQYADTISVWLDDISGDVESKHPRETAARIYRFYTLLKEELGNAELLMSRDKSAFVCSDGETTKALKALLKPDDPKIVSVVKDLGVDAAGAARRRVDQQTQRIQKASKRSNRLRRLKVQRKPVMTRICNVSILTTGTWGHQAQGLAPFNRPAGAFGVWQNKGGLLDALCWPVSQAVCGTSVPTARRLNGGVSAA